MNKLKLNYFIDLGMFVSFLTVAITGIIKFPKLLSSLGISYNALPMREISRVHDWAGIVLACFVLLHLILHWSWIVAMTKQILKK